MLINSRIRFKNLKKWLFATFVFTISPDFFAQSSFVPDSISMIDARFFKSKAWHDTLVKDDVSDPAVLAAIQHARLIGDVPLEAFGNIVMAKSLLQKKKYTEAFDRLNRALL